MTKPSTQDKFFSEENMLNVLKKALETAPNAKIKQSIQNEIDKLTSKKRK